MITLLTDFGPGGPYAGQLKAVLAQRAPGVPVVDLMSDMPAFRPRAAAYLLAGLAGDFPRGTVFLCVVDPGVGSDLRAPVALEVDGRWYVGPDNGLFNVVVQRGSRSRRWEITWRPPRLSPTFHGRDLFAPVAAALALESAARADMLSPRRTRYDAWPDELYEVIYVDHFGNSMTGIRAEALAPGARLVAEAVPFAPARTFADVAVGAPLWFENSFGLAELAVNQGSAAARYGLGVGAAVAVGE